MYTCNPFSSIAHHAAVSTNNSFEVSKLVWLFRKEYCEYALIFDCNPD